MNPILLNFADGTFFFVGLAVAAVSQCALIAVPKKPVRRTFTILLLTAIGFVLISSTPLPLWAYAIWLTLVAGTFFSGSPVNAKSKSRLVVPFAALLASVGLCLAEAPFHFSPKAVIPNGRTVYVLGDSISAGMGTGVRCWPEVLKDLSGLSVINLAEAGATTRSACKQARRITKPNSFVIVEIGGNDLLGETEAAAFRTQLDSLISSLRAAHHDILMFELPLPPFRNAFGSAQREIADQYRVPLIPKRYLTKVLGTEGATLDGLHLSQKGQNAMADRMFGLLTK